MAAAGQSATLVLRLEPPFKLTFSECGLGPPLASFAAQSAKASRISESSATFFLALGNSIVRLTTHGGSASDHSTTFGRLSF